MQTFAIFPPMHLPLKGKILRYCLPPEGNIEVVEKGENALLMVKQTVNEILLLRLFDSPPPARA